MLLFINFMMGLHDGMRFGNLVVILANGIAVLAAVSADRKDQ